MSEIHKGKQITSAFLYVQQVFRECQQLIFKIDNQFADWTNVYGNLITKDLSKSLQHPNNWIVEAIFRVYEDKKDKLVNKCITITYWGGSSEEPLEEPIITAGKIIYADITKRDHWDLWRIWCEWIDNVYEPDGKVNVFHSEDCKHIDEAHVFSWPLVSISDDEALMEKIIKPLKEL